MGNNLPVFFIRDAIKFPDMVHSLKPDPVSNEQDPNRVFDFFSHLPESTHMLTRVYSNYGTPANYREMNGSSVHALKLVAADGRYQYAKFTWKSRQGERNLRPDELPKVQGQSVSHATADLLQSIEQKRYPSWDLYVQLIQPEDMNRFAFNPLDPTKVWTGVAERKVGTMTLNQVPANFFEATEQVAMSPANLVPGIEASEDRLLQGRLFSYLDTQMHRVGTNFQALPVNRPRVEVVNNNQDGAHNASGRQGSVNYEPSRLAPAAGPAVQAQPPALAGQHSAGGHRQDAELPAGRRVLSLAERAGPGGLDPQSVRRPGQGAQCGDSRHHAVALLQGGPPIRRAPGQGLEGGGEGD